MVTHGLMVAAALASAGAVGLGSPAVGGAVDRLSRRHVADLRGRLRRLGVDERRLELYLRAWQAGVLGSFLFVWLVLGMLPVAAVMALLAFASARPVLAHLADARRAKVGDQLTSAARALANQVRAGLPLPQGLAAVSREVPDPLGRELRRVVREYDQGATLADALTGLKERLEVDAVTLFVVALLVCQERGGDVTHALDRISHSVAELRRVERKRESDTASGRLLVTVLVVFPAAFLGLFYVLNPDGTRLVFTTVPGQVVFAVAALLVYGSVRWARAIMASVD